MNYLDSASQELTKPDFRRKTQMQVVKDFGTIGVSFSAVFQEEILPSSQLIEEISTQLDEILKVQPASFHQLLYQIDIPEIDFISFRNAPDYTTQMAELILRREAYKVFLRSKFS